MKLLFIAFVLFAFALSLRLWNFGDAGRWSDEQAIMEHGYRFAKLAEQKDFANPFWYTTANDHPPFVYYIYGLTSYFDLVKYDINEPVSWGVAGIGSPIFRYDLDFSRMVSVIASALCVVLVFIIGRRYFSLYVGIVSAVILTMIPHFVGFSQFVDLENILTLFFTACIFMYLLYLEKGNKYFLVLTGILIGINLMIKESNILILTFFPPVYFVWKRLSGNKKISIMHLLYLLIIAFATCFLIWPMVWLHPIEYWSHIWSAWIGQTGNTPDVFFGRFMGAQFYYYFVTVLITTPVILLILTAFGLKVSFDNKKNWIYLALIIWFVVPFLMLFFHHRQHMVRYIVQFYVPFSLLAALGFQFLIQKFTKSKIIKYSMIMPLIAYMAYALIQISPYYLNYFNELVGGTKNVYEKKLFLIGWFGEGLKNPGIYISKHAQPNAKVGLAIDPYIHSSMYRIPSLRYEQFDPKKIYDYVVVNYYNEIRLGFNENILEKDYVLVYTEKADGIDLVNVYRHK